MRLAVIGAVVIAAVVAAALALGGGGGDTDTAGDDTDVVDDTDAGDGAGDTTDEDAEGGDDEIPLAEETSTTTTSTTTTTTTTTTTLPPDEDCAIAQELDIWVCLEAIALEGDTYVIDYTGEFAGETLVISSGMHLHVFGDHQEASLAGNNVQPSGDWQVIDTPDQFSIALTNANVLAEGTDRICALVADARADRVGGTAHSYYDVENGNCIPIPT